MTTRMPFVIDDGGRTEAGYKGVAGDCVTRAIAIAADLPYQTVYDAINLLSRSERGHKTKRGARSRSSARSGVHKRTIRRYLESLGWKWTPTMGIGTGCRVHLCSGELPPGRLVVSVSKHLTAVIDGVIHDTHDPQREEHCFDGSGRSWINRRCVYGYWSAP